MTSLRQSRLRAFLVLLGLTLAVGIVPQFARSNAASAQTSTGTATAATTGTPATVVTTATPVATGTATVAPVATGTATVTSVPTATGTPSPIAPGVPLFTICGTVSQFTAATASASGTINLAGLNLTIASGTTLTGATIATGSFYCVQAQFNAPGQIVAAVFVTSTSTTASLNVCGSISTFTAASATAAGQVIIGGQSFSVAPGVTFTGATPATGGIFCLSAVFNASSQLNSGSFSAPLAAAEINSLQGAGGYRVGRSYND